MNNVSDRVGTGNLDIATVPKAKKHLLNIPQKRRRLEHGYRNFSSKELIAEWKEYAAEQENIRWQLKWFHDDSLFVN